MGLLDGDRNTAHRSTDYLQFYKAGGCTASIDVGGRGDDKDGLFTFYDVFLSISSTVISRH